MKCKEVLLRQVVLTLTDVLLIALISSFHHSSATWFEITKGKLFLIAWSILRFFNYSSHRTTDKSKIHTANHQLSFDFPTPVRTASFGFHHIFQSICIFFLSTKCKGSRSCFYQVQQIHCCQKIWKYSVLPIRTWKPSSGLTNKLR
jgi:hypothetical protein